MASEKTKERLFGLFVTTVAFLVYANSLGNGFTLDDNSVILNNPVLRGDILSLFNSIDTTGDMQLLPFYRPFTYLTFLIEGRLHGMNPLFVRLFNVLLHSVNALLVYRLARSFFKDNIHAAVLTGLLFAVHPLHSEGVDFNSGARNTMLASFFSIAAYLSHSKSINQQRAYFAIAGSILFLVGLFSKETALMILPCIVALEIRTLQDNPLGRRMQALIRLVPYLFAATAYIIMRWLTLSKLGIQTSIVPGFGTTLLDNLYITSDLGTRIINNVYIIPRYFLTVINPTALASRYTIPDDLNLFALPLALGWFFIIGCLAWLMTKRSKASLFGLAWMVLFWLPVSGIVLVPGAALADRFIYIPAIGLWIIVSDQIVQLEAAMNPAVRRYCKIALAILLLILAAVTVRRNMDWKSNITLYTRFVAQYPDNKHAHAGLGGAYYKRRQDDDLGSATSELEKVLLMDPVYPRIHTLLGMIKLDQEELSSALNHFNEALAIFPYDKEARINRAITYEKLGRNKEALSDYLFFLTIPGTNNTPGFRRHAEERMRELSR